MTPMLIIILFFIAACIGIIAVYMGYVAVKESPTYHLKRRMTDLAFSDDERISVQMSREILQEMSPVDKFFYSFKIVRKLDRFIDNAGLKIDFKVFFLIMLFAAIVGFFIGISLGRGMVFVIALPIVFGILPLLYLKRKKSERIQKFTEQFPDCLDMIARSLRAGHSFSSAMEMIGKEMTEPVSGLFRTAYDEQTLGLFTRDVLMRMLERMESMDLRLFVTAINIHREVGGNLAEMLERLANTIRERLRLRRQIKVYTAQGRLSGYILAALPIFMAVVLSMIAPDYIKELIQEKIGRYAIAIAVTAQVIGFLVIRKLINIKI